MLSLIACVGVIAAAQPEAVQVTATRIPTPLVDTPATVSVISGDQLAWRGATDLRTALAGLSGVDVSPGGDAGPASSVPAIWGLREFDAYLLVVDGVPWGGAFNPAASTLDLHNVERIEVLRGSAPVTYGATSFVGVIHVIHKAAGQFGRRVNGSVGSVDGRTENMSIAAAADMATTDRWQHSIAGDLDRQRFADERAGIVRVHALYRARGNFAAGQFRLDIDANLLRQDPTSPYPRVSDGLDPAIDTDANFQPADARIDQNRYHVTAGLDRTLGKSAWSTTFAFTRTNGDVVRGFLAESCAGQPVTGGDNACGAAQDVGVSDLYFDSHLDSPLSETVSLTWGLDVLTGKGEQKAEVFSYSVDPLHGNDATASTEAVVLEENEAEDERNFYGLYGQVDWSIGARIHVLAGARLNYTREVREGEEDLPTGPVPAREAGTVTRPSGFIGATWKAWSRDDDRIDLFANYRNSFKPAAIDFGPEAEADILKPESADSWELGARMSSLEGRLAVGFSYFDMKMENLVVSRSSGGSPALANAGTIHLRGEELALEWYATDAMALHFAYAHHNSEFGDYVQDFDGVPTELRGNALELSPDDSGSAGVRWTGKSGLALSAGYTYTGERYLNKRNTSQVGAFSVVDASASYRFRNGWEIRLDGRNLTDSRDPISESELGDGQYYRMSARNFSLSATLELH